MNERLHSVVDGEASPDDLSGLSEGERLELAEHLRLQEALRGNAQFRGLTGAERDELRNRLVAAVNVSPSRRNGVGGRFGIGIAVLLIGILVAGAFFLAGDNPEPTPSSVAQNVEIGTISASFVPLELTEPALLPAKQDDTVSAGDEMPLQPAKSTKKKSKKKKRYVVPDVTPGSY